jgi:hypothetical protein
MKFSFPSTALGTVLLSIPICTANYASAWERCITVQGFGSVASISTLVTAYAVTFDRLQVVTVTSFSVITPSATTVTSMVFSTQIFTSTLPQITVCWEIFYANPLAWLKFTGHRRYYQHGRRHGYIERVDVDHYLCDSIHIYDVYHICSIFCANKSRFSTCSVDSTE